MKWLTVAEAAVRVGRSERTVYRWADGGHVVILLGRVAETQLLEADRAMRRRRGRPRKVKGSGA